MTGSAVPGFLIGVHDCAGQARPGPPKPPWFVYQKKHAENPSAYSRKSFCIQQKVFLHAARLVAFGCLSVREIIPVHTRQRGALKASARRGHAVGVDPAGTRPPRRPVSAARPAWPPRRSAWHRLPPRPHRRVCRRPAPRGRSGRRPPREPGRRASCGRRSSSAGRCGR